MIRIVRKITSSCSLRLKESGYISFDMVVNSKIPKQVKDPLLKQLFKDTLLLETLKEKVQAKEKEVQAVVQAKDDKIKDLIASKEKEVYAKDEKIKDLIDSKEKEVQAKDDIILLLKSNEMKTLASYDFLKRTLDARHIMERYERRIKKTDASGKRLERSQYWKIYLDNNPAVKNKLMECGELNWASKAGQFYNDLSTTIHFPTIDMGNDEYLIRMKKGDNELACFVKILASELYGSNVKIQEVETVEN